MTTLDAALTLALTRARTGVEALVRAAVAGIDTPVAQAMVYAVTGGKCLRGFLVLESARLHGFDMAQALPAAAAIECIHAYSLVHDDLPCMDNDDLRRGQPTVHRKWNEAVAVLAGDGLQALAYRLLLDTDCADPARLHLARTLSEASGLHGMVGGQAADIAAETAHAPLTLDQITALQAGKTGALITWSAMAGARMAGADAGPWQTYGDCLGLAFQIADDILDLTGDAATVGKATGKDAGAGKATFVSLLGLEEAKRRAAVLVDQARAALAVYGADAATLHALADFVLTRQK